MNGTETSREGMARKTGFLWRLTERWQAWRVGSTNRKIFAAILTVGSITLLVKVIAMFKELMIARQFGVGDDLDAYNIALMLPLFTVNTVAHALSLALILTYVRVRDRQNKEDANRLLSNIMLSTLIMLVVISVALSLLFPAAARLLASGFAPSKLQQTQVLFTLLIPTILFMGFSMIFAAIICAGEKFALTSLVPAISPMVIMLAMLLGGRTVGPRGIAVGLTVGLGIEMGVLGWLVRRQGIPIQFHWYGFDSNTRQVARQYLPMVASNILFSSNVFVDQAVAARLGSGSVTTLAYGGKLTGLLISILGLAVTTGIMPYFAAMAAREDWKQIRHSIRTFGGLALLICIPVTLLFIFGSRDLVHLLYERGKFTSANTELVSRVQIAYAIQIPFYISGMIGARLLSAMKCNRTLMWITGVGLSINIVADLVLARIWGVAGIGLATSLVSIVVTPLLYAFIFIRLRQVEAAHVALPGPILTDRAA